MQRNQINALNPSDLLNDGDKVEVEVEYTGIGGSGHHYCHGVSIGVSNSVPRLPKFYLTRGDELPANRVVEVQRYHFHENLFYVHLLDMPYSVELDQTSNVPYAEEDIRRLDIGALVKVDDFVLIKDLHEMEDVLTGVVEEVWRDWFKARLITGDDHHPIGKAVLCDTFVFSFGFWELGAEECEEE